MTLMSSVLQLDGDLDSIRNSCDVLKTLMHGGNIKDCGFLTRPMLAGKSKQITSFLGFHHHDHMFGLRGAAQRPILHLLVAERA